MEQESPAIGEIADGSAWLVCEPGLEETETLELKRSTSEIKEACDAESVPVRFEVLKYGFSVVFERNIAMNKEIGTIWKSTRKIPEKYQKILEAIIENPQISRKEISLKLGETEETIQSRMRKLVRDGLLRRVGPDKGGHWEER